MNKLILKYLGYFITLFSFYYIYKIIEETGIDFSKFYEILFEINLFYVSITIILYYIVLYIGAFVWQYTVQKISGQYKIVDLNLIQVFAKSNVGKYIPGNFMQFIGRNLLGNKLGYKHSTLIVSTLFEILLIIAVGFVLSIVLIIFTSLDLVFPSLKNVIETYRFYLIIGLGLLVIFYLIFNKKDYLEIVKSKISINNFISITLVGGSLYLIAFILLGLMNLFVFESLNETWQSSISDYINLLFAFIASWIIGLLVPGAPGGIGIREAVFIFLLSQRYDLFIITLASIIIRLINIIGDVCFFIINIHFQRSK